MYTAYWNLREEPFLNNTDERFAFLSDQHREGLARLRYLINGNRTGGALVGPYGVGKSMVMEMLARQLIAENIPLVRFDAVPGGALPMAKRILQAVGCDETVAGLADALMALQSFCQRGPRDTTHGVLMIDEAQQLQSEEELYFVHYLTNLRLPSRGADQPEVPLFTILLAGTEQLMTCIAGYESLRRRMQLAWKLEPMTEAQVTEYVQHRIHVAGGDIWCFDRPSLTELYRYSQGVPRSINNLCDTALMLGFAAQVRQISAEIMRQSAVDTGLADFPSVPAQDDSATSTGAAP